MRSPSRIHHSPTAARQRGAVAIIVGLCMAVLIGFAGFALDGGRLYVTRPSCRMRRMHARWRQRMSSRAIPMPERGLRSRARPPE